MPKRLVPISDLYGGLRRSRGSAVVFLIFLMSVLTTAMVGTMAMVSGVQSQTSGLLLKRNAAFYAAEAGIQAAIWNMNNSPGWIGSLPASGTLANGCTYTVTTVGGANFPAAPVTFQSVGFSADGTVTSQASITITSTVVVPGMAIGATLDDSGTLNIAGTVEVIGTITRSGTLTLTNVAGMPASSLESMQSMTHTSGTLTVPGNLLFNGALNASGTTVNVSGNVQAGGSITQPNNGWNVTGSTQQFDDPDISVTSPTVNTQALIADGTPNEMPGGNYNNKTTIDFTKTTNGIVYIESSVTFNNTLTIVGSGTLVINGTLNLGPIGASGTPATVNIVTTGDATLNNQQYINGCLCVGGNLTKNSTSVVNGVVVVQQNMTGSGNITLNYAPPPWFIQYSGSGGANIQMTNFSGATY